MADTTFRLGEKPKRRFSNADIIITVVVLAVIAVLATALLRQISLQHEVSAARIVSNKFISDLQSQNATDAHNLGDKSFQSTHSTTQIKAIFESVQPYLSGTPTIVDQTVTNSKTAGNVRIVYKFTPSKPYYVRAIISRAKGSSKWQLINIAGGNSLPDLQKAATVAS